MYPYTTLPIYHIAHVQWFGVNVTRFAAFCRHACQYISTHMLMTYMYEHVDEIRTRALIVQQTQL